MRANQLLNRLTYMTLVEGKFGWDSFDGDSQSIMYTQWADDGVPKYALKQGKDLK